MLRASLVSAALFLAVSLSLAQEVPQPDVGKELSDAADRLTSTDDAGSDEPEAPAIHDALGGTGEDPRALEAFDLLTAAHGKEIRARELAEKILADHPDSFEAHYVVGAVLHRAEGDLPIALYHLKKARALFERLYGPKPGKDTPWAWHAMTLAELASVAGEMDLWQERIDVLIAHDAAYDPDRLADRGWAYMRLRQWDEARESVAAGLASGSLDEQASARTTLCAIEFESQHRKEAYDACVRAVTADRENGDAPPHALTNAALAAECILSFDEAERFLQEATKSEDHAGSVTNPWVVLVDLYVAQRRIPEALEAVKEMTAWRMAQPPYADEQTWAEWQFAAALFLLSAGRAEDAVPMTRRMLERPDRTGFISSDSTLNEAGNAILHRLACRIAAERLTERASWSAWAGWASSRAAARTLRLEAWNAGRRAAALIDRDRILVSTLRPHLAGCVTIPDWMDQELCELLGPGVILAGLDRARAVETLPHATGYFDALAAEALRDQGHSRRALSAADDAFAHLPEAEVTLRARVHAVAAAAALAAGDDDRAVQEYDQVMQLDPGMVRQLGLALPATIRSSADPAARKAAHLLSGSPRFQSGGAFRVDVQGEGSSLTACLSGLSGKVYACATVTAQEKETPTDLARRLCAELHDQAFAPRVDLTQEDIRSLDGSTTSGNAKLKVALDELTGKAAPEPDAR
ncbi:MAG: tetratricopeptide repeat protein [Acidobacteriota bacterium]